MLSVHLSFERDDFRRSFSEHEASSSNSSKKTRCKQDNVVESNTQLASEYKSISGSSSSSDGLRKSGDVIKSSSMKAAASPCSSMCADFIPDASCSIERYGDAKMSSSRRASTWSLTKSWPNVEKNYRVPTLYSSTDDAGGKGGVEVNRVRCSSPLAKTSSESTVMSNSSIPASLPNQSDDNDSSCCIDYVRNGLCGSNSAGTERSYDIVLNQIKSLFCRFDSDLDDSSLSSISSTSNSTSENVPPYAMNDYEPTFDEESSPSIVALVDQGKLLFNKLYIFTTL